MENLINQIILGDCMDILPQIEDNSVDLVFTDPPYNISRKDTITRKGAKNIRLDYGEWDYGFEIEPFLQECKRIINDDGSIIVWVSQQLYGKYWDWFEKNMIIKGILFWVKTNPVPHFRKVGYLSAVEMMFWVVKKPVKQDNPNFNFLTQNEMHNVFFSPVVMGKERTEHPTQKPLKITKEIIIRHCREGGLVLDPFMGSGTTMVACKMLNRNYIGIEKEEKYFEIAKKRLENVKQYQILF